MIDAGRHYTTRLGRPVRIYATDGGGIYPVHGAVLMADTGLWEPDAWRADGAYVGDGRTSSLDLVEAAEERVRERDRDVADATAALAKPGRVSLEDLKHQLGMTE